MSDVQASDSQTLPGSERRKPERQWHPSEYVGSQACADCHAEIAETYVRHPMALTMAAVADAEPIEVVEGDAVEFESQGRSYRVERPEGRLVHTEFMKDAEGNSVYEQAVDVQWSVGSGVNARTYLIDRGGILFESPITWYTEDQEWDLSPGYHDNPGQRFNRRITDDCVQCHSGHVVPVGDGTASRFAEQPFPEPGIGCEKCHGPGQRHVELMESGDWDTDDEMLVVNPSRLDRRLEDSVCNQCHMEGHRRILRKGRSFHDFQPGMATEDVWTVFVSPTPFEADGTARFTSHVEQMHSSACFRGSDGAMRCTTCHDPHMAPRPEERVEFYRNRCNSCHSEHGCSLTLKEREEPPAFNSCIHCHMPVIGSSNIPHTSLSDHRVLRAPVNDPDLLTATSPGEVWTIFDDADERMPEWEAERARALALADQAIYETDQRLLAKAETALEEVLKHDSQDVDALHRLGFLYGALGDQQKARSAFAAALKIDPDDELSLKNLGLLAMRTGAPAVGLQSYRKLLKLNKWDGTMYGPYAALLAGSRDVQGAIDAVERGLQLDPTQRELRGLAVQIYSRTGQREKAQEHQAILQEIRRQLDPWDQKRRQRNRSEMEKSLQQTPPRE